MSTQSRPERPLPQTPRRHVEHDMLVAALPHPILVLGEEDRIIYANSAAEHFFQTGLAVLKRQSLAEVVGFACPLVALAGQVRRTGQSVNEYGVDVATPKMPASRLVDLYGGPMQDGSDLIVIMLQQRSMAKMIERQLNHRAAARSVSGLAAVLAHEIKNPLSGIRGAAQLLEPALSEDDRVLSRLIVDETDRIRDLVDRMEVFGDERPLPKDPVNIHAVLGHVLRLAETGFASHVRFVENYDPSLPPVAGDRDKLIQAFLNLVKNAAEAIAETREPGGRIVVATAFRPGVRLSLPGSEARVALPLMIEIEDNGPGIADAIRPHIFDPFVTSKPAGSGLGLALVAKIIGDHGGVIEFESEPRRTVARVLLPLAAPRSEHKKGS